MIDELKLYFAYGSNMDVEQMNVRCPDAKKYSNGKLPNWKLIINSRGVATIVRSPKDIVEGVIWSLTNNDISILDKYEGVRKNIYIKTHIKVKTDSGSKICIVYIATDSNPGESKPGYLELIKKGAEENHLSESYKNYLKKNL
jgi:hypothetical protein